MSRDSTASDRRRARWRFCVSRVAEVSRPNGAPARHGDRAIAYMLCVKGKEYTYEYEPPLEEQYPAGSYGRLFGHASVQDRYGWV